MAGVECAHRGHERDGAARVAKLGKGAPELIFFADGAQGLWSFGAGLAYLKEPGF
jgi:hypothetical protein